MAPQRRHNIGWLRKNPNAGKPVAGQDFNESDYKGTAFIDGKEWWVSGYRTETPAGEPNVLTTYFSEKKTRPQQHHKPQRTTHTEDSDQATIPW